jgi:DNA-binding HxlR family transcriptional regulator
LILYRLREKPLRLSQLRAQLPGISEKVLIQELKTLAQSDLVVRKKLVEFPPREEYGLTESGRLVLPLLEAMKDFAWQYWQIRVD